MYFQNILDSIHVVMRNYNETLVKINISLIGKLLGDYGLTVNRFMGTCLLFISS